MSSLKLFLNVTNPRYTEAAPERKEKGAPKQWVRPTNGRDRIVIFLTLGSLKRQDLVVCRVFRNILAGEKRRGRV